MIIASHNEYRLNYKNMVDNTLCSICPVPDADIVGPWDWGIVSPWAKGSVFRCILQDNQPNCCWLFVYSCQLTGSAGSLWFSNTVLTTCTKKKNKIKNEAFCNILDNQYVQQAALLSEQVDHSQTIHSQPSEGHYEAPSKTQHKKLQISS